MAQYYSTAKRAQYYSTAKRAASFMLRFGVFYRKQKEITPNATYEQHTRKNVDRCKLVLQRHSQFDITEFVSNSTILEEIPC